jgi:RNA polymerase sigma factor (sigma-70 family)
MSKSPLSKSPHDGPALGSVTQLFALAREGDAEAFSPLWQRFFPRLVALARQRLVGRNVANGDAEDAAQAALISFWSQLKSGEFLQDLCRDSLWNLLATFTVRKVGKQIRHETAAKRGGGAVIEAADLGPESSLEQLVAVLPTQELDVQAAELLEALPADLQELAVLRMLGYSTLEIAQQLDCTQRKVQRKLELIRLRWEKSLRDAS